MSTPSIASGQVLGHYRLIERIGGGGQGEVYRAHDERFDRDVALKILPFKLLPDEAARTRFRKEALAVGKLSHPNIATAYYFGEENGVDFLVTEYVPGVGLDDKLSGGAIPEEKVVKLGIQLASGLDAAHREGIVHRDLKPGNLRITQDGHLKILDFGLAELVDPGDVASVETVTVNMTLTGTVPYMAPEQFGGVCDQRTDLWGAGAVLYEMATGRLPFPETQVQKLKDAILTKDPARPSTIDPKISQGLETVILRALQKDPNRRYQTAAGLRDDLIRVATGRRTRDNQKEYVRQFAVAALAILLVASALAVYHFWPDIRDRFWASPQEQISQFRLLAILPVESNGQNAPDDALVRGMAETVSAHIAQATQGQKLQLIPPRELIARDAKTSDAARREFGVERVLEVAVQRSGDQVRVTCSLIDPRTHQLLNACTVTGNGEDLFALQDNLVGEVIAMLPADARSPQAAPSEVQAAAPAGYEYYLKGRGYLLDYQKPENIEAAIREFEHALRASPNYAPAYAGLGEAYWYKYQLHLGSDSLDKAKSNCREALVTSPKLAEGHICLGNLDNDTGKYEAAVSEFQLAASADPKSVEALSGLAEAYDKMENTAAAEATYQKAIDQLPSYWAVYNWMGAFYAGQARYADAARMFQKVIAISPENYRGYSNLGAMYLQEGHYQESIDTLQHSIELRPTMSAYSNLGTDNFYLHRYPDAIAAFEKARALDEQDYMNWGNLGDALYWSPNRRPEAAAAYKRAIELAQATLQVNPNDAIVRAFAASYSAMLGDRRTAIAELQRALSLAPHHPDVLFRAAIVYNQLGDQQQALGWLRKAVAANFSPTTVRDTPDFDHLRSDPAFKALVPAA